MNNLCPWRCSFLVLLVVSLGFSIACGGGSTSSQQTTPPPPTVDAHVVVSNTVTAPLNLAMSTSFQPAEWDDAFFTLAPTGTTTLSNLLPQHVRLQGVSEGVPQTSATTWDFSVLDNITQPVLGGGDHSPEFQIAVAPAFMYDSQHNFLDTTYQQFGAYAQDLVRYYDTGGFTAADGTHVSPSSNFITWWGIYNEPNFNNLDPTQYTALYNAVVPMMQAVEDASINIKFVAVELGDYSGLAQSYLPAFVSGVTAHVDVLATHFYSTCNQSDTDTTIFLTVPGFATEVQNIQAQMQTNPNLTSVPVWITENNVNADYDKGGGISACNGNTFVLDQRGSSAFFAAWRPYVFSQFAKVGVQALYHWDFDADAQYGEVNYNNGNLQLSYWVDYYLARMFPAASGANILQFTNDDTNVEVLAAQNTDGSVVVMVANHDVANSQTDNNGPGTPQKASVDISALGTFSSASLLTIDANTSVSTGPVAASVTATSPIEVSLNGYGVAFLTLTK